MGNQVNLIKIVFLSHADVISRKNSQLHKNDSIKIKPSSRIRTKFFQNLTKGGEFRYAQAHRKENLMEF